MKTDNRPSVHGRKINISILGLVYLLPSIINSLKKQKTLYKVLTPSIKPPIINSYGLMEDDVHFRTL